MVISPAMMTALESPNGASSSRSRLLRMFMSLALGLAFAGPWQAPPVVQAAILDITYACDRVVTAVEAPAGTMIRLTGPAVHTCTPQFDRGVLVAGNGLTVAASGVTLDLNGRSLRSASNIAAAARRVENIGLIIAGSKVTVINSTPTVSVIAEFAVNIEVAGSSVTLRGMTVDHDANPGAPRSIW